jgi:hypothetical protein
MGGESFDTGCGDQVIGGVCRRTFRRYINRCKDDGLDGLGYYLISPTETWGKKKISYTPIYLDVSYSNPSRRPMSSNARAPPLCADVL